MQILVMAKEPVAGRVKTRLCPPCTHEEAASLAAAALADTLDAATASSADGVVLALDGSPGPWCPPGVTVVAQVDGTFDRRLGAAWAELGGAGVQIGMDTPQVRPADLDHAMDRLDDAGIDAVLGDADDGGWWLIGLHRPDERVFDGVPMSRPDTGARQLARLRALGHRVAKVGSMRDVDHFADAIEVARLAPSSRFADVMTALTPRLDSAR